MHKALLYECFSGIAGDMHMAAMLDLGLPIEYLQSELNKLNLDSDFQLQVKPARKQGIAGTQVRVSLVEKDQPTRHLSRIVSMIRNSQLSDEIADRAVSIFKLLGQAEAKIHSIPVEKVHFHEVGAIDSIVDICAAAIALDYFDVKTVFCSEVELGSGFVRCDHGLMPVPAPATLELLKDRPVSRGNIKGEATTPTGAAILAHTVTDWSAPQLFKSDKVSYGVGHKDFERPNVLRLSLGEVPGDIEIDTNICIECNIDDMSSEAFEPLTDLLFEKGAKEVFFTPVSMKKSRPAVKLTTLVASDQEAEISNCILSNTTTIGLRSYSVKKTMLRRQSRVFDTSMGQVSVKIVNLPNGHKRWKIEHDDVRQVAEQQSLDYLTARRQLDAIVSNEISEHESD